VQEGPMVADAQQGGDIKPGGTQRRLPEVAQATELERVGRTKGPNVQEEIELIVWIGRAPERSL
jgi:hypothetical protein